MLSNLSPDQKEILFKLLKPSPDQKEILFKWLEIIFGVLLIISVILLIIFISKKKKGSTSLKLSIASIITNLEIVLFSAYMKAYYESYVDYSRDIEAPPVFGYIFTGVGIVFFISVVVAIVLKLILINKKKKGKSKEEINKHLNTLLTVFIVLMVCCLAFMLTFCVITSSEPYYSKI